MTLPLEDEPSVALFTLIVPKGDDCGGEEVEVIVVLERVPGGDLSSGCITVQALNMPKNKISIPMKKQA